MVKVDHHRLQLLEQQRSAAFGAAASAGRDLDGLMREMATLRDEIEHLTRQRDATLSLSPRGSATARIADLERKLEALAARIGDARAVQEAAQERQQAAARLYERCAAFANGGSTR